MSSNEPVEVLKVRIEADITDLLRQTAEGVQRIEKQLDAMSKEGKDAFEKTGQEAQKAAVKMGLVAGVVSSITNMLLNLARQIPRALGNAVAGVVKQVLDANKLFEKFSTQFTTLLGGTEAAQKHIQELIEFNIKTPFELSEIVEASRVLEVFGGTTLATGKNLTMVGDIAAGVNRDFADVALWVGRAYDALQSGRPWGMAGLALQRMGAMSGEARAELERMQEQGIKGEEAWQRFVEVVGTRFAGNMERLAGTLVGIQSNLADFRTELLRLSGEPVFEQTKDDAQRLLDVLMGNREPLTDLGRAIGEIAAALERMATSGVLAQLETLDPQAVRDFGEAMDRLADALSRLSGKQISADLNGLLQILTLVVDAISSLINVANQAKSAIEPIEPLLKILGDVMQSIINPVGRIIEAVGEMTVAFRLLNEQLEKTVGFSLVDLSEDMAQATQTGPHGPPDILGRGRGWRGPTAREPLPLPPIGEGLEEEADKTVDILKDATTDMMDEIEDRHQKIEDLETDHNDRMGDITEAGARKRTEIDRKLQEDLADLARESAERRAEIERDYQRALEELARDTEKQRAEIFKDTAGDLADLAKDTDEQLANERDDFQDEERRATEDHLRDMRRLTEDYLMDLEDAVKNRDARAVVDLQRRFRTESQRREEDFSTRQQREREDQNERLEEIRQNEAERRQEILDAQAEQLADLMQSEQEKRAEIERSHTEQLADLALDTANRRAELERRHAEEIRKLDESLALQKQKEIENYQERKAELDRALQERLAAIAQELADEETINAEHAQRLLEALNRTFGVGGDIDKLMEDFASRRRQRMRVEVFFEQAEIPPGPGNLGAPYPGGGMLGMQSGGTLIARKPTTIMMAERGAEMAQFIPLNRMGEVGGARRIEIEFSGSAPPGIRATERDAIAGVLLNALRETGVLQR